MALDVAISQERDACVIASYHDGTARYWNGDSCNGMPQLLVLR